ncbi:MAG TPA: hypothetical protein VFI41_05005 [Gemmatimonadales bacterium]|nr:hypothetical protein [Gemmatimonadales bacterium]
MGRTSEFAGGGNPFQAKARAEKAAALAHALRSGIHGTDRAVVAKKLGYKSVSDTTWGHVDSILGGEKDSSYEDWKERSGYNARKAKANQWLEGLY